MEKSKETHVDLKNTDESVRCTSSLGSAHYTAPEGALNATHQKELKKVQSEGNLQPRNYSEHKKELYTSSVVLGSVQTPMDKYRRDEFRHFEGDHRAEAAKMPGTSTSNVRFGYDRTRYGTTTNRFFNKESACLNNARGDAAFDLKQTFESSPGLRFGEKSNSKAWKSETLSRFTNIVKKAPPSKASEEAREAYTGHSITLKVDGPNFTKGTWKTSSRDQFQDRSAQSDTDLAKSSLMWKEKRAQLGKSSWNLGYEHRPTDKSMYSSEFQKRAIEKRVC